jgi:hypothetical protein
MIRNRHRIGDWLAVDDESGLTDYASNMVKRWDGAFVRLKAYEERHPQEFVRAKSDPRALFDVRPVETLAAAMDVQPAFIGNTNIPTPDAPASHLFDRGIGDMAIGLTFIVR